MIFENIANIMAMIFSLVAIIMLFIAAKKTGGKIGNALKLIVLGIFFAVFVHAGFELVAAYELIGENVLMIIMGVLLTLGSICFIVAGHIAGEEIKF